MKKALAFTTYNRIDYLSHTLISWQKVSDLNSWDIHFYVEPSDKFEQVLHLIQTFEETIGQPVYILSLIHISEPTRPY